MTPYHDPLALFRAAVDALNARQWAGVAALCDPVSLRLFKRGMVERFTPQRSRHIATVEEYLRQSPDMPREVAEYQLAQQEKYASVHEVVSATFPGVVDLVTLSSMEPAAVFAAWLDGCSPHTNVARRAAEGGIPAALAERFLAHTDRFWRWLPLGVVPDGDRMAHILFRNEFNPATLSDAPEFLAWRAQLDTDERQLAEELDECGHSFASVQLCRRQADGGWLLLADDQFMKLGNSFFSIEESPEAGDEDDA